MPSLHAQYIQEREGKHILEEENGFATYSFLKDGVYIEDIFVSPDHRHSHLAASIADRIANIAKEKGFNRMYGSVVPSANHSTSSLKVLIAYGMQLDSATNNFILMKKDI